MGKRHGWRVIRTGLTTLFLVALVGTGIVSTNQDNSFQKHKTKPFKQVFPGQQQPDSHQSGEWLSLTLQEWTGLLTLIAIVGQVFVAGRQADISKTQVSLTADQISISVTLQRAFVVGVPPLMENHISEVERTIHVNIIGRFINTGPTAAIDVQAWINYHILPAELPIDFGFPRPKTQTITFSPLGKDAEINMGSFQISPDEARTISSGALKMFVWGRCEYHDVFDRTPRHFVTFCYEMRAANSLMGMPFDEVMDVIRRNRENGETVPFFHFSTHSRGNTSGDLTTRATLEQSRPTTATG